VSSPSATLKRTPLFDLHKRLGGKLVEFGGWEMPVQYTSIMDEHLCVRKGAGIFDISHMGEVFVSGLEAERFLNHILTNNIRKLTIGLGQYTLMCNERGGVIDDLYAYRLDEAKYLLIINASRIDADLAWLEKQLAVFAGRENVQLKNASDEMAAVAIQGPRVVEFVDKLFAGPSRGGMLVAKPTDLKKNQIAIWAWGKSIGGELEAYVSRTGYTGEDGFEVVVYGSEAEDFWVAVLSEGHASCVQSCGLGARDTLRTEVCYPLYGHELDEETTPIEAGVGFFVSLDKGEFNGHSVLTKQKANGVKKKCVAFKMTDKSAPPRPHYKIFSSEKEIGIVTSGTQSPSLNLGIGIGYVPPDEDFNPEHPTTRSEAMRGQADLLNWAGHNLGVTSTEAGSDWVIPFSDMVNQSGGLGRTIPVPLYQMVYHDAVLISYGEDRRGGHNNLLLGILCGGVPELPADLTKVSKDSLALIKEMAALNKRVALLEMTSHEFLDANRHKERTTFADGTTVTVDWDKSTVQINPPLN